MNEKKNRKCSISDVVAYIIFAVMAIFAIVLIEELIRCFILKTNSIFTKNYLKNIIYLIISSIIYLILMYLEEKNKLFCKTWLKITLLVYVFIALNVLNFFDLYTYRVVKYLIFAINGAFFAIFGVSIYYNYLKNENNKVKAKANMVVLFSLAMALAMAFATELILYLINLVSTNSIYLFKYALYDILFAMVGAVILNIFFYLSLTKTKKFINNCLIDIQK